MGSNKKTRQDQDDDVSSDRPEIRLLVESLMAAQRLANDLKARLQLEQSSSSMDPLPLAAGGGAGALPALVEGISESLSRAIMLLRQSQSTGRRSPLMVPAPARRGSSGGYKRRTQVSQGCRKESRSSMDDGYSWRKYGQKDISAAKYPRSYFRCKHKYEQLCPATRQVQQSEADPSMLDITYIGDHTCTQKQQAIMDNGIIEREDVLSPSTEFESGRDHRAPADHESTRGDDGAPVHLDGSFSYGTTASDPQVMALELGGHAYGDDVTFGGRCYTNTCYTAAAGDDFDDELAAAASSFGSFTSTSTSAMIWELISSNTSAMRQQVQQSEADPPMLDITYIGDHTCTQKQQAIMDNGIIKREDVLSPSTEFESGRDHRAPADLESTRGGDGAQVHLDGSFSYVTASDPQVTLELGGHAYGDDVTFDGRCYTNTYYTAAAGDDFDDELAAAASSFGGFTSTSTSAI